MNMVNWAKSELDRLIKNDEDGMQSAINNDILSMVELFASQGHSGFSASYSLNLIKKLLAWKPITPLTGEDNEWKDVPKWDNGSKTQQNKRCSAVFRDNYDNSTARDISRKVFSDDGGKTWFSKGGRGSAVPVIFPYKVPENPEYIIIEPKDSDPTESA